MENIRIERRRLTVDEYQTLRGTTNWFKIEDKVVEKSIENDLFSVCVYDGQKLVGMGRIVGDGAIVNRKKKYSDFGKMNCSKFRNKSAVFSGTILQ
jgi:hypothetical protein